MGFIYTDAIKKLRKLTKRVKVVPGGTSAGKTFGILPLLIDYAIKNENETISVVSESIPHLRKGALKDFLWIMKNTGRYIDDHYNKTLLTYTFASGTIIEFFSADQEGKVKGPRRNVLYVNECNNISFETYHQLAIRTAGNIWLDFNPSDTFWVHTELQNDSDVEWLTLTYKDNKALAESLVKEIEKARDKAYFNPDLPEPQLFTPANIKNYYWHNWWRVYGLGLVGSLEGVIFTNWSQIAQVPPGARLVGYCMDFGYTNDPSTLTACYLYNGKPVWDELFNQKGLKNGEIANLMKGFGVTKSDFVVADSSEPKSIAEINSYGFSIRPAVKGPDSVKFGIDTLQQEDFFVTARSINIISELRKYMWAKDKAGNTLNEPIDAFNHHIDPMRYLATAKLTQARKKRKGIKRRN